MPPNETITKEQLIGKLRHLDSVASDNAEAAGGNDEGDYLCEGETEEYWQGKSVAFCHAIMLARTLEVTPEV